MHPYICCPIIVYFVCTSSSNCASAPLNPNRDIINMYISTENFFFKKINQAKKQKKRPKINFIFLRLNFLQTKRIWKERLTTSNSMRIKIYLKHMHTCTLNAHSPSQRPIRFLIRIMCIGNGDRLLLRSDWTLERVFLFLYHNNSNIIL